MSTTRLRNGLHDKPKCVPLRQFLRHPVFTAIWTFRPRRNTGRALEIETFRGPIKASYTRYTRMGPSYDVTGACRVSRQLLGTVLSKLRIARADNGPESSVATAVRFRCTTSRSDSFPLVNHKPTYDEETVLTKDSEHTYRQLPSLRKEENNILVLLTWSSTYHGQTLEVLSDWINRRRA